MRRIGFTLLELLIVVAVVALLIGILLPALRTAREQARIAACLANYRNLLVATHTYFNDFNDSFPFYTKVIGTQRANSSWLYGGKTSSDWWKTQSGGTLFYSARERPLNRYLQNRSVSDDDAFPQLRCPSDRSTYQRVWGAGVREPDARLSAYDDVGTSYHFNIYSLYDVTGPGLPAEWSGNGVGWAVRFRALLRDVLARHSARYAFFHEDPVDYGIGKRIQVPGHHAAWGRHALGFVDGHAAYLPADTRRWCGPGYTFLNPDWVWDPAAAGRMYYKPAIQKNCD